MKLIRNSLAVFLKKRCSVLTQFEVLYGVRTGVGNYWLSCSCPPNRFDGGRSGTSRASSSPEVSEMFSRFSLRASSRHLRVEGSM